MLHVIPLEWHCAIEISELYVGVDKTSYQKHIHTHIISKTSQIGNIRQGRHYQGAWHWMLFASIRRWAPNKREKRQTSTVSRLCFVGPFLREWAITEVEKYEYEKHMVWGRDCGKGRVLTASSAWCKAALSKNPRRSNRLACTLPRLVRSHFSSSSSSTNKYYYNPVKRTKKKTFFARQLLETREVNTCE